MSIWGYRSFDDTIVLEWIENFNKDITKTLEEFYKQAQKDGIEDITKNQGLCHVLVGIISYAIYEEPKIKIPKKYLVDAIKSANILVENEQYLQGYARPIDRKGSLRKEMYIISRLIHSHG